MRHYSKFDHKSGIQRSNKDKKGADLTDDNESLLDLSDIEVKKEMEQKNQTKKLDEEKQEEQF